MEPRFTRGEYWILETVVKYQLRVCDLIYRDLELLLNKREHGLTRKSLIETFHRLLSSGLIYAKNKTTGFISTYQQIELALDEPKSKDFHPLDLEKITCYGLTQEGGTQWEAFAAPNWQKYIAGGWGYQFSDEDEYGWELICADKAWLESYIEALCYHDHDYKEVISESVAWDYVTPWQATYWKQLDGGHRIRFQDQAKTELDFIQPPSLESFYRGWYAWQ